MALANPETVPTLPSEIKRRIAEDRLAARLLRSATAVYAAALSRHAEAVGGKAVRPRDIRDPAVAARLKTAARASAESIVSTAQRRRAALIDEHGGKQASLPAFKDFSTRQADVVSRYEASIASHAAARDFAERNADILQGEEWVSPDESSGDEACESVLALGRQPLNSIDPLPPLHPNCIHALNREYFPVAPEDTARLWTGSDDTEEDSAS